MARKKKTWIPAPGHLARYVGKSARLLRDGRALKIVAEAAGQRMVVEAIGHHGVPVKFSVMRKHLDELPPQLF